MEPLWQRGPGFKHIVDQLLGSHLVPKSGQFGSRTGWGTF